MKTLTDAETFAAIVKHGIQVRQIRSTTTSLMEIRHKQEGDEVVSRHGREMILRTKHHDDGGKWLSQPMGHRDSTVRWSHRNCLADTLNESVALCLRMIEDINQ